MCEEVSCQKNPTWALEKHTNYALKSLIWWRYLNFSLWDNAGNQCCWKFPFEAGENLSWLEKQTCLSFLFFFLSFYITYIVSHCLWRKGHGIHDLLILKFFHFYLVSTHHQCLHHSKLGYANKASVQGWIIPCCTRRKRCLTSLCTGAFIGEIW